MSVASALIIGHVTKIHGPVQALAGYSRDHIERMTSILHPIPYSDLASSEFKTFVRGGKQKQKSIPIIPSNELLCYLQHIVWTLILILKQRARYDVCIGIDGLNAFAGILLRKLGFVGSVVFYVIDYTPKRFGNPLKNASYHALDRLCVRHTDYVWNISERIARVRREQGVETKKNLIVPVGVDLNKIPPIPESDKRRTLVFASHLTKSKGADLIVEAMKDLVLSNPTLVLEIVGTGPYERNLKELVATAGLGGHVRFRGLMAHDELMRYLPLCKVALATYMEDPTSISYFADPTKPKEYLACGLPVVITRVPWIASVIEERPMGIAIDYDKQELIEAISKLLTDDAFYGKCRENALAFAAELSWDIILAKAFSDIS